MRHEIKHKKFSSKLVTLCRKIQMFMCLILSLRKLPFEQLIFYYTFTKFLVYNKTIICTYMYIKYAYFFR